MKTKLQCTLLLVSALIFSMRISAEASCSGTSKGVDPFYTNADKEHAVASLDKGYDWHFETTTEGVKVQIRFLDALPGMTAPELFMFDENGVLIGNPIPMTGWNEGMRTVNHTITGVSDGTELTFLVKMALEGGKVLFTERFMYVVGSSCEEEDMADPIVGSCSDTSKEVDEYYTKNDPAAAQGQVFTQGYTWKASTTQSGKVNIEVVFHDYLPGMTAPNLFLFDANGVLVGDPVPMRWLGAKAYYTLEDKPNGTALCFLVKLSYELHVLFTERVYYVVGQDCEKTAIEHVQSAASASKKIENGQFVILRNGVRYNASGIVIQ